MNPVEIDALVEAKEKQGELLTRLRKLVEIGQNKINEAFKRYENLNPPDLIVEEKQLYWKLVKADTYGKYDNANGKFGRTGSQSVYCWVRKVDGAILKGDWKKPDTKPNRIRGYLTDSDDKIASVITDHGVVYLK